MRQLANKKRSDRVLQVGDSVYLKLQPYKQKSMLQHYHKLVAKYYGPYVEIKRIGKVAYKLNLPSSLNIHPVFHVSILKMSMEIRWCIKAYRTGPGSPCYSHKRSWIEG